MLAYEVDGDGPALLLVHGTMSSREVWAPVRERLARERRLILIDLPGMGASPPLDGAHLPGDWVESIGAVLDAAGAPRPAVAGHSMGGWTALELARAGRAASVLALAPAGLWRRSPRAADASLRIGRALALLTPPGLSSRALAVRAVRRAALRAQSADGGAIPAEWAVGSVADVRRATGSASTSAPLAGSASGAAVRSTFPCTWPSRPATGWSLPPVVSSPTSCPPRPGSSAGRTAGTC